MTLAATRLIPMRKNKGKSIGACLHNHTSYIQNPDKTEQGELVSSYQCSPLTVDEEFLLTKRLYEQTTGRSQKSDVIAYQIRQSFKPGEITAEEANKVGYELAMRFTKGKHAFIVATHTDRAHIHNHIIYNSTALDGTRKFKNFWLSSFAVQRLSDLICLEHQLSTIEYKPYRERQKRIVYPPKESNRDRLCSVIDSILAEKPKDYEDFLLRLEQQGYEVKRGKHTAVKGKGRKRFIRFRTLGNGYGENEIKAVLEGKAKHQPYQKQPPKDQPFQLLVDIQGKMAEGKSVGYKKWATKFNLKEMSKTLLFLQEQKINSAEELRERAAAATERYHAMGDSIKAAEARLTEIAVLKTHIINYAKTRPVYDAYRKSGYSKKFLEAHREEITLHKAAKTAFDEAGLQKLPKVKELDAEFAELLTQKKAAYPGYRKARNEMQELVRAQKNVERFFAEEKDTTEKTQTR
ncbi:relaxase/mobilization nuclease domain-containing protein [Faecalibacterium prausnitzii]|uniref:relaxase/mobilization nuclease domain-containing protein n=1 Tax=Faecalibacterium prausnitzii TaxID=853 RepID=UPI0018CC1AC2|nr:relaxase/mobilization nuclease domain-containing protein [Faecalibacterium prausnitzii]